MMSSRRIGPFAAVLSLIAAPALAADPPQADLVKRGEYLARAGDCFSCHTQEGGKLLAGGRQNETPFGTIASPNITPDRDTGIGTWSDDDFVRVMHEGLDKDGNYIYPIMPYDHYTLVTREDDLAIKAYLFSLPPVHAPKQPNHLSFPFSVRSGLGAWRALYFTAHDFKPDPGRTPQQNRGGYLVEGLGHCGSCHTPRNAAMASEPDKALGGGEIKGQGWFAPNISSDVHEGLGSWSEQQVVDYLKAGVAPGRAVVAGPMAEVVHTSLRYLSDDDLHAMAAYLKAAPAKALYTETHVASPPGATAYLNNCASCHQPDGKGLSGGVPPLAGNGAVLAGGPQDVIRTVLGGLPATGGYSPMPGFALQIPSAQIAEITNYVRTAFGNGAPATATTEMVDGLAKTTHSALAGTGDCGPILSPPVKSAIDKDNVTPALHAINASNMTEQIDAMLPKMATDLANVPKADVVNGITAGYCQIVMADASQPKLARVELLQRFTGLVYSRLSSDVTPTASNGSGGVVSGQSAPGQVGSPN